MQVSRRLRLNLLYDFYGELLTGRQRQFFEMHFQEDLSLGEIAANLGISRQAVHDLLGRTARQLEYYEERLELAGRHGQRLGWLAQLEEVLAAGDLAGARDLLERLKNG